MRARRPLVLVLATIPLSSLPACKSEGPDRSQACCRQPIIPAGVPAFNVVKDDVGGPTDGQTVSIRAGFKQRAKRDEIYPALHVLYRFAMKRDAFEPTDFTGELFNSEADAQSGSSPAAKIWKKQGDQAPRCEILTKLDFPEQVKAAFDWSLNRGEEEDPADSCHLNALTKKKAAPRFDEKFTHKPTYKADPARKAVEVAYPYLEMGKDEYVSSLTFNNAMTYWAEFTTTMFKKGDDIQEVTYVGLLDDQPALKITVTRPEFEKNFSNVQETVAAHSAITFASLGLHKTDDKGALKEQESFRTKTYLAALDALPKEHVLVSPRLKKEASNVRITPKGLKRGK